MSTWIGVAILLISFLAALVGMIHFNRATKMRTTPGYGVHRPASHLHPGLSPIPLPPPPGWHTKTTQTMTTALPDVYKDEVDGQGAIDAAVKMAKDVGMSAEEITKMREVLEKQIEDLPTKPPEANDTCPECGGLFALVDDYLCPKCRAVV